MFHLPVLGSGDGGIYTTAADITTFWRSLFTGKTFLLLGWDGPGP